MGLDGFELFADLILFGFLYCLFGVILGFDTLRFWMGSVLIFVFGWFG